MTINVSGGYIIVEQASVQTAFYGVRHGDRIIKVNGKLCTGLDPGDVVTLIQRYNLIHSFSLDI